MRDHSEEAFGPPADVRQGRFGGLEPRQRFPLRKLPQRTIVGKVAAGTVFRKMVFEEAPAPSRPFLA